MFGCICYVSTLKRLRTTGLSCQKRKNILSKEFKYLQKCTFGQKYFPSENEKQNIIEILNHLRDVKMYLKFFEEKSRCF